MTKEEIFSSFEANIKTNRTNMFIVGGVGAALFITGVVLFFTLEHDNVAVGSIIGGIGLIFALVGFISVATKSFEKKTQKIKDVLNHNPQHLVWAYVLQQNNRGAVSVSVVMNFKDKSIFHVDQNAIPNRDTAGFMRALQEINPAMPIGYSEELEYKFKKGTL